LWQLPRRRQLLHQLADRLAPGGILLVQEWTVPNRGGIVQAPDPAAPALVEQFQTSPVRAIAPAERAEQLAEQLDKVGFTQALANRLRALLIDPWLILAGWPLHSVSGQRPR